jgi:NAD(P)-dependent dehydrogenase (short-subunit alcohol dehydrogenase family)
MSMPQARALTVLEVVCDVTEPSSIGMAVDTVQHNLGPVDVLVNNAGIMAVAPLLNQSKGHFEEAMDTNFMHTTFAILPGMLKRRKGSIVNIASIGGLIAVPHAALYDQQICSGGLLARLTRGSKVRRCKRPYGLPMVDAHWISSSRQSGWQESGRIWFGSVSA